jgi:hypothetical protein
MAPASEINLMYDREEERPGIPSLRTVMPTPSRCQECCEIAVTKRVEFWRLIGAVVLFHFASKGGWLCKSCIHKCFWDYTLITAVLGWWGCISFVLTPFVLLHNTLRYIFCLWMPSAPPVNDSSPATGAAPRVPDEPRRDPKKIEIIWDLPDSSANETDR